MRWFTETAPIRLKLLTAFGLLTCLTLTVALVAIFVSGLTVVVVGIAATIVSIIMSVYFRHAISTPYVATVVRMEGLAAGDLTTPILFVEYTDCVGRMTKAMFTFRDAALAQIVEAEEQTKVVRTAASSMSQLASGDLTADITADFPPAYVELKTNFNEAVSSLRELIRAVGESAEGIRTGSTEIAQASEDLARRTEGSAASLEETSAALVQIDGRLKATAVAASRTVERADQAITTVGIGRATAEEAVAAMVRVSGSAKGIASVIEGVDKIAFQTRVLAMNAAVEAGRAGDAGRGFAVVADLVSALAMRAEEEAKRARDQLTVTQSDIITAVEAVQKVDGALANISGDVGEVHQLLGSMATDNQAQSSAITQVSAAIGTMDQLTQQNAAMVEQTSAAARNLTTEVKALAEQAAMFKVDAITRARPVATARANPAPIKLTKVSASPAAYRSPVKALPAGTVTNGATNDWKDF